MAKTECKTKENNAALQTAGQWAALYVRVSTDAQAEEGYSLEAQKEMMGAWCKSQGIKQYQVYEDGGYTGSNIDRPEMQRMVNDAKEHKLSHVVVYKLDRLSRSQKDTLYLIEDVFNLHNVSFVSIKETLDTSTPLGRLMIGILSAFAQLERENIRERTRMGMLERVKDGYWMGGGRVPFGYDYDSEKGILVPNQDAETVKRIYSLYLDGYALYKIAQLVGLKYERLAMQILNRKTNCGYITYNGVEYKGRHEPIIDEEVFDQAMQMQQERSIKKIRASSNYLLTGLVYCGNCGAKMRYQKWGKSGYKLVCYSQDKNKPHLIKDPNCQQGKVWADEIESEVIQALFHFKFDYQEGDAANRVEPVSPIEMLMQQHDMAVKKISRLYNLYGENGDDILLETIESAKRDLEQINKQLQKEQERGTLSSKILRLRSEIENLEAAWPLMSQLQQQTIARELIKSVTIKDTNIKIEFNF